MMVSSDFLKEKAAQAAVDYIRDDSIVGVGTGSTVGYFIAALSCIKNKIQGCVASSLRTVEALRRADIPVYELSMVDHLNIYIDGADEVTANRTMIKGGGGALTREKILATVAEKFICIVDQSKLVKTLGAFPIAVEVLPMARSFVGREIIKLGGDPVYREQFLTDNGNIILDVHHLDLINPMAMEEKLKQIPGVVENGLFIKRAADLVLVAHAEPKNPPFHYGLSVLSS